MADQGVQDRPFDREIVEAVAADHDVPTEYLEELIGQHQSRIRETPGADNLVYEWRRHFDGDVLDRTDRAFYVSVPATLWTEFADDLSVEATVEAALRDTHRRQVRAHTGVEDPDDDRTYVLVERT